MIAAIEAQLKYDVAGDPITGIRWTHRTTEKIAAELATLDIQVCPRTVARILKDLHYRLRVNHKRVSAGSGPDRDQQFTYIASQREKFAARGLPIVSIDAKKRELVGNFKNPGRGWAKTPQAVNDHDFRSQAIGIAIPYGIYDVTANRGFVVVGTSHDTPDFAADNLLRWWQREGCQRYPSARELLVLADSGGSNAARVRCFKYALQTRLADPYQLTVTVCHYPSGASKWNPIDPSPVQRDQQELGWPSAAQLPDHPQPHPYHLHCHRATGARRVGRRRVSPGRQDNRCRVRFYRPQTSRNPTATQLLDLSTVLNSRKAHQNRAFVLAPALSDYAAMCRVRISGTSTASRATPTPAMAIASARTGSPSPTGVAASSGESPHSRGRREDETVRRLIDCLIAAVTIGAGVAVLHRDDEFDVLARDIVR